MRISTAATTFELDLASAHEDTAGAVWFSGELVSHATRRTETPNAPAELWELAEPVRVRVRLDGFGLLAQVVLKALTSRGKSAKAGPVTVVLADKPQWRQVKEGADGRS